MTYVSDENFAGEDWFTYSVCAQSEDRTTRLASCNTATAFVHVQLGELQYLQTTTTCSSPQAVVINILEQNAFVHHGTPIISISSHPQNGQAQVIDNKDISYLPALGFAGTDILTYKVCLKGNGPNTIENCQSATVSFFVSFEAQNEEISVMKNSEITMNLLANDCLQNPSHFEIIELPVNGEIKESNSMGEITWVPHVGWHGIDRLAYKVCVENKLQGAKSNRNHCSTAYATLFVLESIYAEEVTKTFFFCSQIKTANLTHCFRTRCSSLNNIQPY